MEISTNIGLLINAPEFFRDPTFINWLNNGERKFALHRNGPPDEWSDVIVLVDPGLSGEGSDSDMPGHILAQVIEACRTNSRTRIAPYAEHIVVRLTNLENSSVHWSPLNIAEYVQAKTMLEGISEQDLEASKPVAVDQGVLATLVSCAQAHVEDVETGIEDALYVEAENADLPSKKAAVETASLLLQSHAQLQGGDTTQETTAAMPRPGAPPECPHGGYFITYGYEKSADHRDTLTEARKRGQVLCDEDPLPSSWSIHDAMGEFVEDIKRSNGKSLEDLTKAFEPIR